MEKKQQPTKHAECPENKRKKVDGTTKKSKKKKKMKRRKEKIRDAKM